MIDLIILAVAFVIILVGAELFTNGIEWFGRKLELAEGAVGSVLAAVGTALPETMIPLIAILFGGSAESDAVGVGAVLGAPFMLSTLAMFVTGVAVLLVARERRKGRGMRTRTRAVGPGGEDVEAMPVDTAVLGHDIVYFAAAYALALGVAFLPAEMTAARWVAAVVLLGIYAWYVKGHFEADPDVDAIDLAPLRFHRLDARHRAGNPAVPRLRVVNLQVLVALACIVGGAYLFVGAVEDLAHQLDVDGTLLALVIAPIATELPEKFNSVIWVRQGKDTLAMGNITGAMVFQSAIPTSVALIFASESWAVTGDSLVAFASAGIAFASSAAIFVPMWRRGRLTGRGLLVGGVFYLMYLALVGLRVAGVVH
jgi:cation:H+ antiporter